MAQDNSWKTPKITAPGGVWNSKNQRKNMEETTDQYFVFYGHKGSKREEEVVKE